MQNTILVFAKYPTPGKCKTRLIGRLSAEEAADLHRQMTIHTLQRCRAIREELNCTIEVHFSGGTALEMQLLYGDDLQYIEQVAGDLGDRLRHAMSHALTDGCDAAIVIGTDCPTITPHLVANALDRLASHDIVIAPATDGGYVLLGIAGKTHQRANLVDSIVFTGVDWGSENVLKQTVTRTIDANYSISLLESQSDVDRPEDLDVWFHETARPQDEQGGLTQDATPVISVVIPTLNHEPGVQSAIAQVLTAPNSEAIVAAAGQDISSIALATAKAGGQYFMQSGGRGQQLNAGAAIARSDVLLFLHADTQLPHDYASQIETALVDASVVAGAFQLRIASDRWSCRLIEFGVAWRCRLFRIPYGDQAIFVRRSIFEQLGGFPDMPIMEDYALVRKLRSRGKIAMCPSFVVTSGRRWQRLGAIRTTLINQLMIAGYHLGISPERLAKFYRDRRPKTGTHKPTD